VAYCRVSYRDIQGIGHSVTVEAESLFEAVAMAVKRFRETLGEGCPPGPACAFSVQMHRDAPVEYTVDLKAISDFARDKAVRSPKDMMKRARIREWLGVDAEALAPDPSYRIADFPPVCI
jgi:hypothetical protein